MFDIYIYKAIEKQNLSGQNQLAKMINISSASMARLKTLQSLPSEETLLKVAALAGIAPEKALIDLNMWRAKDDEKRLNVWKNISKMIGNLCAIYLIYNCFIYTNPILSAAVNVYYVYLILLSFILFQYSSYVNHKLNLNIL